MAARKSKKPKPECFISRSKESRVQELRIAEDVGGRRTPASGAFDRNKGDVETRRFLIEAKITESKRFSINEKVLSKIDGEALNYGKIPALVIDFPSFRFGVTRRWAVIPYPVFARIVRALDRDKEFQP